MISSESFARADFAGHLAVFAAFGKGPDAQRICENADLGARFRPPATNVE
jgi:hypothetical protein